MSKQLTKVRDGVYEYRGVILHRDDRVRGHWGHWYCNSTRLGHKLAASTRQKLIAHIDAILDAPVREFIASVTRRNGGTETVTVKARSADDARQRLLALGYASVTNVGS